MPKNKIKQIFDFLHLVGELKNTKRFKTVKNIKGDTVAAHTWRMALLTFMLAEELKLDINILHAVKLALTHDLAEAITDDIDAEVQYNNKKIKQEKISLEKKAMKEIAATLPNEQGKIIFSLWQEYVDAKTPEAKFVVAVDKIEGSYTLLETGNKSFSIPDLVATYADESIKNYPPLSPVLGYFKTEMKKEFTKGNIPWKGKYDI